MDYIARHVDCEGVATYIIASFLGMRTLLAGKFQQAIEVSVHATA